MSKRLVVFFSLTGTTRLAAKAIAKELNADIEEIVPVRHYPLRGAWLYVYGGMQALFGATPRLEQGSVDIKDYDTVIIGTPVWSGRMAPPVRTFLTHVQLEGKSIAYFCAHRGGEGHCLKEMADVGKVSAISQLGLKMTRKATHESVNAARQWARDLERHL